MIIFLMCYPQLHRLLLYKRSVYQRQIPPRKLFMSSTCQAQQMLNSADFCTISAYFRNLPNHKSQKVLLSSNPISRRRCLFCLIQFLRRSALLMIAGIRCLYIWNRKHKDLISRTCRTLICQCRNRLLPHRLQKFLPRAKLLLGKQSSNSCKLIERQRRN